MGFCAVLSKLLIVSVFILAGINKFQDPSMTINITKASINHFDDFLSKDQGLGNLPLKAMMLENVEALVYIVAGLEVVGGLLVVAGSKFAAFVLALLVASFTLMVHNPFYKHFKPEERMVQWKLAFFNTLIMFALLMVVGHSGKKPAVEEEPKADSKDNSKRINF